MMEVRMGEVSEFVGLDLLGLVRMLGTGVDLELSENRATEAVVGDHSADGTLDEKFGTAGADLRNRLALLAADVTGVAGVDLVVLLVAGETHLGGVHDDNEVPAIDVRREEGFALAAKQVGGGNGDIAENFAIGVDDMPLTFDFFGFGRKGLHFQIRGFPGAKRRRSNDCLLGKSPCRGRARRKGGNLCGSSRMSRPGNQ